MDAKEARRFTMNNPPTDMEAERRPSLLGRLFRRMSSSDSASGSPPNISTMGQNFGDDNGAAGRRRESITEQVQAQFTNQADKPKANADPVFNLFT